MRPTLTIGLPDARHAAIGALEPIHAAIRPVARGATADVRIDGRSVHATLRHHAGTLALSAWSDTRGQPPGLHDLQIEVRFPDGSSVIHQQLVRTAIGEVPDLPPLPVTSGPTPVVCRADAEELQDAVAATAAGGGPLILLDPGAELATGATEWVANAFADGTVDLAIGDEATRLGPRWIRWRKPAFQPETLPGLDQVGPLLVLGPRAAAVLHASPPPDAGLYGMALELLDRGLVAVAARRVLTFTPEARIPVDDAAQRRAVRRLAARRGRPVEITAGPRPGLRDVRWPVAHVTPVVAVVPSCTPDLARRCLDALAATTTHAALTAVLVGSGPHRDALAAVAREAPLPVTAVDVPPAEEFNYHRAVNVGLAAAAPDADVLFLNDDVVPLRPDWLTRMVEMLSLPRVGVVGAFLRFPDGRVQHGGVSLDPTPRHVHHDAPADAPGRHFDLLVPGNPDAVTGACVLVRRALLDELEGHDEQYVQLLGDIDLCLRATALGARVAWCAAAELEHGESTTYEDRMHHADHEQFSRRWGPQRLLRAAGRTTT